MQTVHLVTFRPLCEQKAQDHVHFLTACYQPMSAQRVRSFRTNGYLFYQKEKSQWEAAQLGSRAHPFVSKSFPHL